MKRLLSIILTVVMLVGLVPFALAADASAAAAIALDEVKTVNADRYNPVAEFVFTAAEEGDYVFYSESEGADTFGHLCGEDGTDINWNDDYHGSDFAIFERLSKDQKVTLKTRLYDMKDKATYNVKVSKRTAATAIVTDKTELTVYPEMHINIDYSFAPVGAYYEEVTVTSSDDTVVSKTENGLYSKNAGTAVITYSTESGLSAAVTVTVKDPAPLALDTPVSATAGSNGNDKYSFTPAEDGYYTFTKNSNSYGEIYLVGNNQYIYGEYGTDVSVSAYLEKDVTYVVNVNSYTGDRTYTVEVTKSTPATQIVIESSDGNEQYIGLGNYLYAIGIDGEVTGDVEWSVSDEETATVFSVAYNEALLFFNKAGTVTVTAKLGDATATYTVTGIEAPVITLDAPVVTETVGVDPAYVKFTAPATATYRISATDEIGDLTWVECDDGEGNRYGDENFIEVYLQEGKTYTINANRHFYGIGFGFDENDYVGDITIDIAKLEAPAGLVIDGGDTITAYIGDSFSLIALPTNENGAFEGNVGWSISDEEKGSINWAHLDMADILFYEVGEYTVTATYGEFTDIITVEVVEPELIELDTEVEVTLSAGNVYTAVFIPEKSGFYTVSVAADSYVEVYLGNGYDFGMEFDYATGLMEGTVYYLNLRGDAGTTATITVKETTFPTKVKAAEPYVVLAVGDLWYPYLDFDPAEISEEIENMVSSNENVVTVDEYGDILAVGEGTATVEVTTQYGLKTSFTVTVVGDDYDWAYDITLNKYELSLNAGASEALVATVEAETEKTVYWMSEDESVARVDANGRVTGISEGTTYIFVFVDGIQTACEVTVTKPEIKDSSKVFKDVKAGKWYSNAIDYCYSYNFIAGTAKDTFGLNTKVTRGMFITILARIAGVDTTTKGVNNVETKFTDVKSGKYYANAIKWANDNGIVSGTSETTFSPDASISRQDLCVMVVNFAKFMDIELTAAEEEIKFTDASSIRKYAKDAVKVCQMADIVNGYTDGSFGPTKTATRAEAAQILYKLHVDFIA